MSATVMMNPSQLPHRKPVPMQRSYNDLQQQQQPPAPQYTGNYPPAAGNANTVPPNRSPVPEQRTTSVYSTQTQQTQYGQPARRTLSNATSSSTSTNQGLQRVPTNPNMPRRSTSSRSTGSASPTSYVALMRKQKATVWCDRAQAEDPRVLARDRAAKMRAAMEVAGGTRNGSRVSTGSNAVSSNTGIRSKIRHQGAPKASAYLGGANMSGAGVPIRLSATEVDENDSDEDWDAKDRRYHQRNGSRQSSLGSGNRASYLNTSQGSTPPSRQSPGASMGDLVEEATPVPNAENMQRSEYFDSSNDAGAEAEQRFGGIGGLPYRTGKTEQEKKMEDELRRRGSVDDRAMTMSGVRLYVANPDLSD